MNKTRATELKALVQAGSNIPRTEQTNYYVMVGLDLLLDLIIEIGEVKNAIQNFEETFAESLKPA